MNIAELNILDSGSTGKIMLQIAKAFITQKCITKVALLVLIAALFFTINSERYVWDLSYYIFMMYGIRKILLPNEEKILFFSICKDAKLS